ncbi:hypothetical protein C0995_002738 [Termitomyces sp. Mi166|nr:hypothetical protein C0995_002738 [Termitomyces sp. Mi166\
MTAIRACHGSFRPPHLVNTFCVVLSYFSLLVTASLLQFPHDSQIFHCYVHKFPWAELRRSIAKAPPPPPLPQVFKKMPSIIAPKPQRPPPVAIYNHRGGLGSEYEIESYATPQPTEAPLPTFKPPPALLSMMHNPLNPYEEFFQSRPQSYAPSFYPQQVQAAITPAITPEPVPGRSEPPAAPPVRSPTQKQLRLHQAPPSEPPPLGNWPRRSVLASSAEKVRRKPPPPNPSLEPIIPHRDPRPLPVVLSTTATSPLPSASLPVAASSAAFQVAATTSHIPSFPPRARPSGPRRRSDGEARATVPQLYRNAASYQPG